MGLMLYWQWIFTKNHHYVSIWKSTFRHTIIPVQLALCFSLIVQGNNESQGILPAEEEQLQVLDNERKAEMDESAPWWMHPLMSLPFNE